jgi:hypothetical protein
MPAHIVAAESVRERLISKLAMISSEANARTAAFMAEIAPRQAALLEGVATPDNLMTREGRDAIRGGYLSFSKLIDDMESFDRAEEVRVDHALAAALSEFPRDVALEARSGFKRGWARVTARHATLRAVQRQLIRANLELVDVIENSPGGVSLAAGRLVFPDRQTHLSVSRMFAEIGRLEMEEQRLEREVAERRSFTGTLLDLQ